MLQMKSEINQTIQIPADIIKVINKRKNLYVFLYIVFCFIFAISLTFLILAFCGTCLSYAFGHANADEMNTYMKIISSLDFDNPALKNINEEELPALWAAILILLIIVLTILTLISGFAIKLIKKLMIKQTSVTPLLPGFKKHYIPCEEGIYKLYYYNLVTRNKFYALFPWDQLSLYNIKPEKLQICVKTGRYQMPLEICPSAGSQEVPFSELYQAIINHLSEDKRNLPMKKEGYHFGRAVIALIIVIILQFSLANWMETASEKGKGNVHCDIGGWLHIKDELITPFGTSVHTYQVYDVNNNILHNYCELHGVVYAILHPIVYFNTLRSEISHAGLANILKDSGLISYFIFPVIIWTYILLIIGLAGKPPVFRFRYL